MWLSSRHATRYRFDDIPASHWNKFARLPTQRHCWARACLKTINARDEVRLISFGDALAPFIVKRKHQHRLASIGDFIPEPFDVLSNDDTVDGLAEAIVEAKLPLFLKRIPADAAIIAALRRAYHGRGLVKVIPWRHGCPYIDLDDTWCEPERHFSKNRRQDIRKRRREARSIGDISVDIITPDSTNVNPLVEEAFEVEAAGWKRVSGTAIAVSRWRSAFYSRFAKYASEEGILRLCFLRIDGRTAAMEYSVECGGCFFNHKIGYDETFAHCSPGNLLRVEIIRYAAERGLRSYEFQGMDEPWTYYWTKSVHPMVSLKAYPSTA